MIIQKFIYKHSRWQIIIASLFCISFATQAEVVEIQQNLFHAWMEKVNYRESDPESWTPSEFTSTDSEAMRLKFPTAAEYATGALDFYQHRVWTVVYDGSITFTNLTGTRETVPGFPKWGWPNIPVPSDVANNPADDPVITEDDKVVRPKNNLNLRQMELESKRGDYRVMTNYWNIATVIPDSLNDPAILPLEVGTLRLEVEDGWGNSKNPPGAFTVLTSPNSFWRFGRPRVPGTNNGPCLFVDEYLSNNPCQWAPQKPLNPFDVITTNTPGNHAPAAYPAIYNGCHYGQCTKVGKVVDPDEDSDFRFVGETLTDLNNDGINDTALLPGAPYPIRMDMLTSIPSHWITDVTRAKIVLCEKSRPGIPRHCDNEEQMLDNAIFNVAYDIWIDKNTPRTETGMLQQTGQIDDKTGFTDGVNVLWPYEAEPADKSSAFKLLPDRPSLMKQNDGLEIMIWVANNGYLSQPPGKDGEVDSSHPGSVIRPAGTRVLAQTKIEGVEGLWDVWVTLEDASGNNKPFMNEFANWNVVSYVRIVDGLELKTGVIDFPFDSKWFLNHAATLDCGFYGRASKCLERDWWITSIQAGFEIWANGENLHSQFFNARPSSLVNIVQGGRFSKNNYVEVDAQRPFLATASCDKPNAGDNGIVTVIHPNGQEEKKALFPDQLGVLSVTFDQGMKLPSGADVGQAEVFFELNCASSKSRDFVGVFEDYKDKPIKTPRLLKRVDVVNPARVFDKANNVVSGAKVELYYRPNSSVDWLLIPDGSTEFFSNFNQSNPSFTSQYGGFAWEIKKTGYYKVRGGYGVCHSPDNPTIPYIESASLYRQAGSSIAAGSDLRLECPNIMADGKTNNTSAFCKWYSDGLFPMCKTDTGWWGWENNSNCISQSACNSTGNETVYSGSSDKDGWLNSIGIVSGPSNIPNGYGPLIENPIDNEVLIDNSPTENNSTYTIAVNAKGTSGTETVRLTVGGNVVATWTLGTNFTTKTFTTNLSGGINVEYINDYGNYRDVIVDYVDINGVRHEAENQTKFSGSASGTGNCATGHNAGWMHCNGYIGFNAFK